MNDSYDRERFDTPEDVKNPDMDRNRPEVNSDLEADRSPIDRTFEHEMPKGENFNDVDPMSDTVDPDAPVDERIPSQDRVNEPLVDESASKPVLYVSPVDVTVDHDVSVDKVAEASTALLSSEESEHFRTRWNEIQGQFVDEPRTAVQQADELVSDVVEHITEMFTSEHSKLESQWKQGEDVSTEDLRKALQRYRSFFNRLVV